jgi:molybdopterin synthase catalytic subunit
MDNKIIIEVLNNKINVLLLNSVFADSVGACVFFIGVVRNINFGKSVKCIEYYVLDSLFNSLLYDKCKNLLNCNKIEKICIFQRKGNLIVGDINLMVGVGTIDRCTSFYICNILVEYIKHSVPIWKKEFYNDSTYFWINSL